jgi:arylsulfatase A-like enzyme
VIYTSDQGMFLGDHGWHDKRFMYEESLRMPFIARLPGAIAPGSVSGDMLLNVDFAPTFLDYAELDVPDEMQGSSGKQLLEGDTPGEWPTSMYYRYWMHTLGHKIIPHYGVRNERYKLIYYYGGRPADTGTPDIDIPPEWELFDLEEDLREMNNVYSNSDYSTVLEEMMKELDRLQAGAGDVGRH